MVVLMSDTTETDDCEIPDGVEPPFVVDDTLCVQCDHSGCTATTSIGMYIDAVQASTDRSAWRVSFQPTADGRLEVDGVECPDHRVDDAIDSVADAQSDLSRQTASLKQIADDLDPNE
jgi:hypothetical protein